MCHGDDHQTLGRLIEDHNVRIRMHPTGLAVGEGASKPLRIGGNPVNRGVYLVDELSGGTRTSLQVPIDSLVVLLARLIVKFNFHCPARCGAVIPREWCPNVSAWLCPR